MLSKKKILLLGADGMLGSMVYSVLKDKYQLILAVRDKSNIKNLENAYGKIDGHTILEFDFAHLYQDYLKGFKNLTQSPVFKGFLENVGEIDALINCAGIIIPNSLKDPALTFFINSAVPHLFSAVFKEKMIHITTDCVFNGLEGFPYDENASVSATDLYGISKFLGEPKNCLTLRTSIIGPEISGFYSLLEWFKKQQGQTIKGFTGHFWNGVTTKEFAQICTRIIENRQEYPKNGLFHVFSTTLSKYEMLCKFKEKYQIDCQILPDDSPGINRTLSTIHPVCEKLQISSFDKMLQEL